MSMIANMIAADLQLRRHDLTPPRASAAICGSPADEQEPTWTENERYLYEQELER